MSDLLVRSFAPLLQAFQPCFTQPSFRSFWGLVCAWILCSGRRSLTRIIQSAQLSKLKHYCSFHRFFSQARWDLDDLGHCVFDLLLPFCSPALLGAVDDTLARKSGRHIWGADMHPDPLRSTRSRPFFSFGHNWVVFSLHVCFPFAPQKHWAIPILMRLYRKRESTSWPQVVGENGKGSRPGRPAPTSRLTKPQLEAVLAHELCHVRRRDNLTAAIHMIVEAVFWFHPLVWWIGARLVDERERACDEYVLRLGSEPQVYAEGILKVCEFYVESPLTCVAGVTGNNLKNRMERIMRNHVGETLNIWRKLFLVTAGMVAVAAPIVLGALNATPSRAGSQTQSTTAAIPAYATVSITPNKSGSDRVALMYGPDGFISNNASLQQVIREAYGVEDDRISGAPAWLGSEKYDVEAREHSSVTDGPQKLSPGQPISDQKPMLQALLADRLKLTLHRETRDLTVYALVIAKDGPKLQESQPGDPYPNGFKGPDGVARPGGIHMVGNQLIAQGVPVGAMLFHLSRQLHRTLLDETALSGTYDFTLKLPDGVPLGIDNPVPPESYESAVSSAIGQQLGLKLELRKASMEVLVIDHIEKPSESRIPRHNPHGSGI